MLYDYLKETYGENEPIFITEIRYKEKSLYKIFQQIKDLTNEGLLKEYDTGIYFIPKKSVLKSGSTLSRNYVIEKRYLYSCGRRCGYVSGLAFANQLGLTTQVPAMCEVYTNKASSESRSIRFGNTHVILYKPKIPVAEQNFRYLQLLDLLTDIEYFAEAELDEQREIISSYMRTANLCFEDLQEYLPYYPKKTYKNMKAIGLFDISSG